MSYKVDSYHVQSTGEKDGSEYEVIMFDGSNIVAIECGTEKECREIGEKAMKHGVASIFI